MQTDVKVNERRRRRLEQIDAALKRWQSKLTRALNALAKLERERKRLQAAIAKPAPARKATRVESPTVSAPPPAPVAESERLPTVSESGLPPEIPAFLRRGMAAQKAADEAVAAANDQIVTTRQSALNAKQPEGSPLDPAVYAAAHAVANAHNRAPTDDERRIVREAKRKAKKSVLDAELRGQRRKFPLEGKAALAAIRGK